MRLLCLTILLGLVSGGFVSSAFASQSSDRYANVTLAADRSAIVPGQTFTVAVIFEMKPTWHIYWREPGDSGMPPSVKWTLPAGLSAGEFQYPIPERLETSAGVNFVYHDQAALLVEFTASPDLKPGQTIEIQGDFRWLVCDADRCLPERQPARLTLSVAASAEKRDSERFEAWRRKVAEGATFKP